VYLCGERSGGCTVLLQKTRFTGVCSTSFLYVLCQNDERSVSKLLFRIFSRKIENKSVLPYLICIRSHDDGLTVWLIDDPEFTISGSQPYRSSHDGGNFEGNCKNLIDQ
jgi:hypothetical protein